ncbi:MAG: hypothetical protein Q9170_005660 [Blastenia crenularia]
MVLSSSLAGCGCKDCKEWLDPFLRDPHRQRMEFLSTGQRRSHMQARNTGEASIKTYTKLNFKAPHILVLKKTRNGYDQALKAWQDRHIEYTSRTQKISGQLLNRLLAVTHTETTDQPFVNPVSGWINPFRPTRQPLADVHAPARRDTKEDGKPKLEIIDLSEDF